MMFIESWDYSQWNSQKYCLNNFTSWFLGTVRKFQALTYFTQKPQRKRRRLHFLFKNSPLSDTETILSSQYVSNYGHLLKPPANGMRAYARNFSFCFFNVESLAVSELFENQPLAQRLPTLKKSCVLISPTQNFRKLVQNPI